MGVYPVLSDCSSRDLTVSLGMYVRVSGCPIAVGLCVNFLDSQPVSAPGPQGTPGWRGTDAWGELRVHKVGAAARANACLFLLGRMTVWLSTAPTEPLTHWYQVRCLFQSPLFAKAGDTLSGTCLLIANKRCELLAGAGGGRAPVHPCSRLMAGPSCLLYRQSYDISIVAQVDQTGSKSSNLLDLKNPFFR